ncbi:MAG: superoxide dismutase [Ni] [Planctomycetota bacterium]
MTRSLATPMLLAAALVLAADQAAAHCQVPCGVYGDQRRFDEMLEDAETIAKAITSIGELAGTHDANGHNQLARWVVTKEDHAKNVQHVIADYFLAQRVKADADNYVELLKASHAVTVAAMKAKQSAEPATAKKLAESIKALYAEYTGEPYQAAHVH